MVNHRRLYRWALPIAVAGATIVGMVNLNQYRDSSAVPAAEKLNEPVLVESPDGKVNDPALSNFLETAFMLRGYCRAATQAKDTKAAGGFAKSENAAKPVGGNFRGKGLFLLAEPSVATSFDRQTGMRLSLVNGTKDLLGFPASDSRLDIVQHAQDEKGEWRPIEFLPSSWCGNSYHTVFLQPGHFWEFAAPRYKGTLPTKIRFALTLTNGTTIFSNEFAGSINPSQFTDKQGYQPRGLMDPFNE